MILVDTNIIIDYWHSADSKLETFFKNNDVALTGIIKSELLCGAKMKITEKI